MLIGLCAILAPILSGCTPIAPIYIGIVDGGLAILVCDNLDVDRVSVGGVTPDTSPQGEVIWQVSGDSALNVGDVIVVGRAPNGLDQVDTFFLGLPDDVETYTVSLQETDADGVPTGGPAGSYDASLLQSDTWLSADGQLVEKPC